MGSCILCSRASNKVANISTSIADSPFRQLVDCKIDQWMRKHAYEQEDLEDNISKIIVMRGESFPIQAKCTQKLSLSLATSKNSTTSNEERDEETQGKRMKSGCQGDFAINEDEFINNSQTGDMLIFSRLEAVDGLHLPRSNICDKYFQTALLVKNLDSKDENTLYVYWPSNKSQSMTIQLWTEARDLVGKSNFKYVIYRKAQVVSKNKANHVFQHSNIGCSLQIVGKSNKIQPEPKMKPFLKDQPERQIQTQRSKTHQLKIQRSITQKQQLFVKQQNNNRKSL